MLCSHFDFCITEIMRESLFVVRDSMITNLQYMIQLSSGGVDETIKYVCVCGG